MIPTEEFFSLIKEGSLEKVRAALDEDPTLVNARAEGGTSAALLAAYYQHPVVARLVVKYGAQIDIFEACAIGLLDEVENMLSADPEQVNAFAQDGFQPLGLASFFGHLDIVNLLLQRGAQVDCPSRNPMQVMPLHSAVAGRSLEVVAALIEHSASPDVRQAGDFTPLHAAAQNGDHAIVQQLLAAGADPNPRDAEGKTPLSFALAEDHAEVVDLLRGHGAE